MQYFEPHFIDEALVLLERFGDTARLVAGGTRVGFALRQAPANTYAIVNMKRIEGLSHITHERDTLRIGTLATAAQLQRDPLVRRHAPLLALAASMMGARQLQTLATIGGNVCSRDPASDLAVALLACDAQCTAATAREGTESMSLEDVLTRQTDGRKLGALVIEFCIPIGEHRWSYQRMTTRRTFEMPLVAAALQCTVHDDVVVKSRLALAGVGATVIRSPAAEAALLSRPLDDATAAAVAKAAAAGCSPTHDQRASAQYRRALVTVLVKRAVLEISGSSKPLGRDGEPTS